MTTSCQNKNHTVIKKPGKRLQPAFIFFRARYLVTQWNVTASKYHQFTKDQSIPISELPPIKHPVSYICPMEFEYLIVEQGIRDRVSLIRLNRPRELNALCLELMDELVAAFKMLDNDPDTGCIVITGNDRAFAAGADIKQMAGKTAIDMHKIDQFSKWDSIKKTKTPIVAAVSGFALGGGCELTMLCDMIVASETAQFGQPEIKIGVMPGAGGTQRLTRAVGKARAMEMVLTGKFISAREAFDAGLVNRVAPPELYLDEALSLAGTVASMPPLASQMAKEAVLKSFDTTLDDGLLFERKNFYLLFATEDQTEGMEAFVGKRPPVWKGQ